MSRKKSSGKSFPVLLLLPADEWDELFKLSRWIEDMPDWLDLGDHAWDDIYERTHGRIDDLLVAHGLCNDSTLTCTGVETEGRKLIALLETDESMTSNQPEHRCTIRRSSK